MRKSIWLWFLAVLIALATVNWQPSTAFAANKMWWATCITGGGDCLDGIAVGTLTDGDGGIVVVDNSGTAATRVYRAKNYGSNPPSADGDTVVAPATSPGNWRWLLTTVAPPGTNGTNGTNGIDGCSVLYGTIAPTTEGKNCDWYIDTTAPRTIYGPKASGTWPSGVGIEPSLTSSCTSGACAADSGGNLQNVSGTGTYVKRDGTSGDPTITESDPIVKAIIGIVKSNGSTISAVTAGDITGQLITGFSSGAGTVVAGDTLLQAINKLDGNIGGKAASGASTTVNGQGCALGGSCTVADSTKLPLSGGTMTGGVGHTIGTASPSSTGTTTIDLSVYGDSKFTVTPSTASQAVTIAFSNRPATGAVTFVRIQIIAPASGAQTIVWPTSNTSWLGGISGILTALAANKHYEYACEIENVNTFCAIISEGAY